MVFNDLDKAWRLSISGSISNFLKGIGADCILEDTFEHWYGDKFTEENGTREYVKIITDDRLVVDDELLEDIKEIFKDRFYKKIEKVKVKDAERVERQKVEKATEKQLKYARNLYEKVHGKENNFDDKEYSKLEMVEIIGELVEKFNKIKYKAYDDEDYGKVIEFKRK